MHAKSFSLLGRLIYHQQDPSKRISVSGDSKDGES